MPATHSIQSHTQIYALLVLKKQWKGRHLSMEESFPALWQFGKFSMLKYCSYVLL